jgi:hypothetical protein
LQEIASDIDWESDYFYLQFLTLGKVTPNVEARAVDGPTLVPELPDLADRMEFQFSGEPDLNEKLREAISAGETIDQEVAVHFRPSENGDHWVELGSDCGRRMFVGNVSGSEVADLYSRYKYRLFSLNIRDYVGDTATNSGIIDTALSDPLNFLFFNNGISAVATQITDDAASGTLNCRRLSIINGAQTVRSLRKAQAKDKRAVLKTARVLIRIMEFSLSKEHEFLTNVTKFNNTQNSVKISDFRSNDPIQKDLARKFEAVVRGGKTYWYKNKRSRETRDRTIPINMEDFAKAIHAFREGPDDVWGGTRYLFDIGPKGGYTKVYGEPVSNLSEDAFRLLGGTFFVCEYLRFLWEEQKSARRSEGLPLEEALERRWMVFYGVAELLRTAYADHEALDADLRRLKNPKWIDENEHPAQTCLLELFKIACSVMKQTYDAAAKAENFRHRNWFRSESTLRDLKNGFIPIPTYRGIKNPLPKLL